MTLGQNILEDAIYYADDDLFECEGSCGRSFDIEDSVRVGDCLLCECCAGAESGIGARMKQFLAVRADGSIVGVLLDATPIMPVRAVEAWWAGGTGVRCHRDLGRAAAELEASIVVELVHKPVRVSSSGATRRYPEISFCRVVHATEGGSA